MADRYEIHAPDGVELNNTQIHGMAAGVAADDAVNKSQMEAAILAANFDPAAHSLSEFLAPTADLAIGGFKLTGVANGTAATDAATKGQLDQAITDLVGLAPATLDTLQEIATSLQANETSDAALVAIVSGHTTSIGTLQTDVSTLQTQMATKTTKTITTNTGGGTWNVANSLGINVVAQVQRLVAGAWRVVGSSPDITATTITVSLPAGAAAGSYRLVVIG